MWRARRHLATLAAAAALASACYEDVDVDVDRRDAACRPRDRVTWYTPDDVRERRTLDAWCGTVGTPVIFPTLPSPEPVARLLVVSWNVNVGGGDLAALVRDLRSGSLTGGERGLPIVLLVQEALRAGGDVPSPVAASSPVPARIVPSGRVRSSATTVETAARLGLAGVYVPSMRNGTGDGYLPEDRGPAIFSTLPLASIRVVELPVERQRRVVVGARLEMGAAFDGDGLWVMSVHLENRSGGHRVWLESPRARTRQVRSLLDDALPSGPMILAGDLNSWASIEPALDLLRHEFDAVVVRDNKPTHAAGRLDEIFARVPERWRVTTRRLDQRYGSDHYPLLGMVEIGGAAATHARAAPRGVSALTARERR